MTIDTMKSQWREGRMRRVRQLTRVAPHWALVIILTLGVASCDVLDSIISVDAPSQVAANDLDDPANAGLLVNSAINDFQCALSHYIAAGALVGSEFQAASNLLGGSFVFYDARILTPGGYASMYATGDCSSSAPNVYEPLSTARWMADDALRRLDTWDDNSVPNRTALISKAAAFAGYSLTLLGEGMCSAALDMGPEMTTDELFAEAEARFTRAITAAETAGEDNIRNLALVGRARVRLNLGNTTDAAQDAAQVPDGFEYTVNYSNITASTENRIFTTNQRELIASVEAPYRNMTYQGQPDPRVEVVDMGMKGPGSDIDMWAATKYDAVDSPVPVATWEEAQLIVAEAALEAGQLQDAVDIIDALHTRVGLPGFASTDATEIRNQLIYERRAELFLEGQHLQDIERFNLPLDPAPGTPFVFGGTYGDQICYPLPDVESMNNPNI